MNKLKSICICLTVLVLSSCHSKKADLAPNESPSNVLASNETIRPYLKCKAEDPKYSISIVQWISWMDGITPRARFCLDLADKNWNVRSFDSISLPTSPVPGRLVFHFARGNNRADITFTSGPYGTLEISENGGPIERVNCTKANSDDFISPSEHIKDYTWRLAQTGWCHHVLVNKTVKQYIFHWDGRYEDKTCEWDQMYQSPEREISTSFGTWILDKNLKMTVRYNGGEIRYDIVYLPGDISRDTEFRRYLTMDPDGDSNNNVLWHACPPCRK